MSEVRRLAISKEACEAKIAQQVREMWETYLQYNPDGQYLTIAVLDGSTIMFSNEYTGADIDKPIEYHKRNAIRKESEDEKDE